MTRRQEATILVLRYVADMADDFADDIRFAEMGLGDAALIHWEVKELARSMVLRAARLEARYA